jgi:hypothetical protein
MQTPDVALPGIGLQTFEAARSFERATSPGTFSATSRSQRSDGFPPISRLYTGYTSDRMKIAERRLILHRRTIQSFTKRSSPVSYTATTAVACRWIRQCYALHYGASIFNDFSEIPGFHLRWAIVPVSGPSTTAVHP